MFAESYFEIKTQAEKLVNVYKIACESFSPEIAKGIWQTADENTPVSLLLARKLKLLAESKHTKLRVEPPEILKEYADYIELMQQRINGLEITITYLNGVISATLGATSWRLLIRSIRYVKHQLLKIKIRFEKL